VVEFARAGLGGSIDGAGTMASLPFMRTILIVDDQPSVLMALEYLFRAHGYDVVPAADRAAALTHAESRYFDVALVDLHMPGADGTVVCRDLGERAAAVGRKVPVWMMTAAHTSAAAAKCHEAGAQALLKKPFDVAELSAAIEALLGQPVASPAPTPTATVAEPHAA
jgi:DNA-binding response OmpR family regulator